MKTHELRLICGVMKGRFMSLGIGRFIDGERPETRRGVRARQKDGARQAARRRQLDLLPLGSLLYNSGHGYDRTHGMGRGRRI